MALHATIKELASDLADAIMRAVVAAPLADLAPTPTKRATKKRRAKR
jgi:hypothetical protein